MNILSKGPRKWTDLPKALIKELVGWPLLPAGNPTDDRHPVSKRYFDQNALGMLYLEGLDLKTAADAANDVTIKPGVCRDDSNTVTMNLASQLTKRTDALWTVGDNSGGFDTGTKPSNDTIHNFLIYNPTLGIVDALWSASATNPTLPTGYVYKRRIGSRRTDGTAAIINMHQYGNTCLYDTPPVLDVDVSNQSTTAINRTLLVPTGFQVEAIINPYVFTAHGVVAVYFRNLDLADVAPSTSVGPIGQIVTANGADQNGGGIFNIITSTSGQISTCATASGTTLKICTLGWIDKRGRV